MIPRRLTMFASIVLLASTFAAPPLVAASGIEQTFAAGESVSVGLSPPPCQDGAYNLIGGKWPKTYNWYFKSSSTPAGLVPNVVQTVINKSFDNITNATNDCGMADNVSATHAYQGNTTKAANCDSRDNMNVVSFGRLSSGVLAVTCYWTSNGKVVEADIKITNRESWAMNPATCRGNMPVLEATATHEAGHVFGLAHVGEKRHGRLTMSPYIDGPCEGNESTLGKGDIRGLEQLY